MEAPPEQAARVRLEGSSGAGGRWLSPAAQAQSQEHPYPNSSTLPLAALGRLSPAETFPR